jgi:hypothetical protein
MMAWSYNTGQRGSNWVRAYEKPDGSLYLEWFDVAEGKRRRARQKLPHRDHRKAEDAARKLADYMAAQHAGRGTVHQLIDDYLREVTPAKGESKQAHDKRASRLFKAIIPPTRLAEQLSRAEWDAYIVARRSGSFEGLEPVGERVVSYDLKFMIAVLGWGVGTGRLVAHPWGPDVRRTQRWVMPKTRKPRRPEMTREVRDLLAQHCRQWRFAMALELGQETWSRNVSIRQLRWRDCDMTTREFVWQREKDGEEYRTPMSDRAHELLRTAPSRGIGAAWVFPSMNDPGAMCTRHDFQRWLRTAKRRLLHSITDVEERDRMRERLRGLGYHGAKRAAVRDPDFRRLPDTVRSALARTAAKTLDEVYDEVGVETMRAALRQLGR